MSITENSQWIHNLDPVAFHNNVDCELFKGKNYLIDLYPQDQAYRYTKLMLNI